MDVMQLATQVGWGGVDLSHVTYTEFKHDVYDRRQRLPLIFYSFVVILK